MSIRSFDALYIGGEYVAPSGNDRIEVISPHTEKVMATVPNGIPADMDKAVAAARRAFDEGDWAGAPLAQRLELVRRFDVAYQARVAELGQLITAENGSPAAISELLQAVLPAMMIGAFISLAEQFDWESERTGTLVPAMTVRREPVGVVAAVVPWNVPQLVTLSKVVPALLAGCTVVLKPAPETPLDAYVLCEALQEAGIPPGVVNMVPAGREAGEHLVAHPGVDKVAFTGSTAAGRTIARICGEQLKRCSLELGGKSAAIILDDADLEATALGLKMAAVANSGQACASQTRILASRDNYDNVVDAIAAMMTSMPVGDPQDPATEVGPLVAQRQQERVEKYIALGQEEGCRLVVGGPGRPAGLDHGWYVQPTVFADAHNQMRICREEIFGPVVTVIPYGSVDEAVRIANDTEYGLAGSVWTGDIEAGTSIAHRLRTGTVGINGYMIDFNAPFGGYKASGVGREFGPEGLAGYTELKSIFFPAAGGLLAG